MENPWKEFIKTDAFTYIEEFEDSFLVPTLVPTLVPSFGTNVII